MVCAPVRSIIPSLKLEDYLSVQAHKPGSISHLTLNFIRVFKFVLGTTVSNSIFCCKYQVCYKF